METINEHKEKTKPSRVATIDDIYVLCQWSAVAPQGARKIGDTQSANC